MEERSMPDNRFSLCRIEDLSEKEVIAVEDCRILGCVEDVEFDLCTGKILALLVPAERSFLGLGRPTCHYKIPWNQIEKIGDDVILVCHVSPPLEKKRNFCKKLPPKQ